MSARFDGRVLLVIGGARSGKSRYAQAVAEGYDGDLIYVATAQGLDEEMRERIARHRVDRGPRWRTVEAPLSLGPALEQADSSGGVVLVDCLTLWASNLLVAEEEVDAHLGRLEAALAVSKGSVVLVTNEVGWGIVPDNALARRFRDIAGLINQRVAACADRVHMVVAGLPIVLK